LGKYAGGDHGSDLAAELPADVGVLVGVQPEVIAGGPSGVSTGPGSATPT
jgi:hypothetical protein